MQPPLVPGFRSNESIPWKACREAEKLTDLSLVDELAASVRGTKSKDARRNAYFIIGKIGANTGDASCATRLVSFLDFEKNRYCRARLLQSVGEVPKSVEFDYAVIEPWLRDTRWLVRHAAIEAFKKTHGTAAEEYVLTHLAQTTDATDQTCCHAVLNRIGSSRAIPLIERGLTSRTRDVRLSAKSAILEIVSRSRSNLRKGPGLPNNRWGWWRGTHSIPCQER